MSTSLQQFATLLEKVDGLNIPDESRSIRRSAAKIVRSLSIEQTLISDLYRVSPRDVEKVRNAIVLIRRAQLR